MQTKNLPGSKICRGIFIPATGNNLPRGDIYGKRHFPSGDRGAKPG
jgi:hypothetical protein